MWKSKAVYLGIADQVKKALNNAENKLDDEARRMANVFSEAKKDLDRIENQRKELKNYLMKQVNKAESV